MRPPICAGAHRYAARKRDDDTIEALSRAVDSAATIRNCGPILHVDPKLAPEDPSIPDFSSRAHAKAVKKRNRRLKVALRRAVARNDGPRGAKEATQQLGRMLKKPRSSNAAALKVVDEILRRALQKGNVDPALVDRLAQAVSRVQLRHDAVHLRIPADDLAEVRLLAADVAKKLISS